MLKEIMKQKYKLINELNDSCTTEELQEIQKVFEELRSFKVEDSKLRYTSLNQAITNNKLDCYETSYYNAYKLQSVLEEYKDDGFITYACENIAMWLECKTDLHMELLAFFDNLIINEDFTDLYRDYLMYNQQKTEEEANEIIEKLGL